MTRLSNLVNNDSNLKQSLTESLVDLIEMIDNDVLSEYELETLEETVDFIVEELDESECEGCGEMFPSSDLNPETGLCESCSDDDELVESVKRRKKKKCPAGKKRVGGKCVKKSMKEIKAQKRYYKLNKRKIAKASAKWRKANKSYLSRKSRRK